MPSDDFAQYRFAGNWHRHRRPIVVSTALSTSGALIILLVLGMWLLGWLVGQFVMPHANSGHAILQTTLITTVVLGIGCNALCFALDRHLNHFGAQHLPALWLISGLLLSVVGGVVLGTLLFSPSGRRLLTSIGR